MTRTVGFILIAAAIGICLIGGALLGTGLASGKLQASGAVLGFGLLFVFLIAPLGGVGVFSLARGRQEQATKAEADAQRKILDMVKTRGQVSISDVIIELQSDRNTVQSLIYKLVGMGVFSGYVNWDEGILYSSEAAALHNMDRCKHCGGEISLAGVGIIKCKYCGTEYFLAK